MHRQADSKIGGVVVIMSSKKALNQGQAEHEILETMGLIEYLSMTILIKVSYLCLISQRLAWMDSIRGIFRPVSPMSSILRPTEFVKKAARESGRENLVAEPA